MLNAQNVNGKWVLATNALSDIDYYCPVCRDKLSLIKDSKHKIDHFRHRAESTCSFGADETPDHAGKKYEIYSDLQSELGEDNVRMEYRLDDGQRPDIYFEVDGQGVAVEIQHSNISDFELLDRTASYSSKNVAALWMPDKIQQHLSAVEIWDTSGLAKLPLWMRRIAKLTDDVAFDQLGGSYASGTDVMSIRLKLERRTVQRKDGVWVNELYWPTRQCKLYRGNVRDDTDDKGHRRILWLPSPIGGEGLVSLRPKREQRRREFTEDTAGYVDCTRSPVDPTVGEQGAINFHEATVEFWAEHSFSPDEKRRLWGF